MAISKPTGRARSIQVVTRSRPTGLETKSTCGSTELDWGRGGHAPCTRRARWPRGRCSICRARWAPAPAAAAGGYDPRRRDAPFWTMTRCVLAPPAARARRLASRWPPAASPLSGSSSCPPQRQTQRWRSLREISHGARSGAKTGRICATFLVSRRGGDSIWFFLPFPFLLRRREDRREGAEVANSRRRN